MLVKVTVIGGGVENYFDFISLLVFCCVKQFLNFALFFNSVFCFCPNNVRTENTLTTR